MSLVRRSAASVAGAVVTALLVGGCATALLGGCATEVDPDIPEVATGASPRTTEFRPVGSTAGLLDQLVAEAGALSEAIVANEGQGAIIERIDLIWDVARTGIEDALPDSLAEFDRAIAMLHTGVDRRRPADADKAYNNLVQLSSALP